VDPRESEQTATPWPELEDAARRREIPGLLVLAATAQEVRWLAGLPVPVHFVEAEKLKGAPIILTPASA
jgi:hypothetical protein